MDFPVFDSCVIEFCKGYVVTTDMRSDGHSHTEKDLTYIKVEFVIRVNLQFYLLWLEWFDHTFQNQSCILKN